MQSRSSGFLLIQSSGWSGARAADIEVVQIVMASLDQKHFNISRNTISLY